MVVAFAAHAPVGLDVERIDPALNVAEMVTRALAEHEVSYLLRLSPDERPAAFFAYWTRKEAVLKATGDGLAVEPSGIHVSAPGQPPMLLAFPGRPHLVGDATITDLSPGSGYVAALCVLDVTPGHIRQLDAGSLLRSRS